MGIKRNMMFGIDLPAFYILSDKRLQMIGVIHWFLVFMFLPGISPPLFACFIFFSDYKKIATACIISYLVWIWVLDREIPHKGGRGSDFYRKSKLWKWYSEYFPITLQKTVDLDQKKNYLFCSHPHGLLCSGVVSSFAFDGCGARDLFPGFESFLLTFDFTFIIPILREVTLFGGFCSASRKSMNHILSHGGGGNIAVLMPGGAPEALDFHPGEYVIQLKNRKGFVKVALQNGSPLVPVFSFGENEIYDQVHNPKGSFLRTIQDLIQQWFDFPPVLLKGRGIFQKTFGFLPKRHPINVVVGAPIKVEKIEQPTKAQIDDLHEKYVSALTELFYKHRDKYSPNSPLIIT